MRRNVEEIELTTHQSSVNEDANWRGGPCRFPTSGAARSSTVYYELKPGKQLGWHENSAEEIQFVISGRGELILDGATESLREGDLIRLEQHQEHDIRNVGDRDLRIVAFFPEPQVEHSWASDVWHPDDSRVTETS